MKAVVSEPSIGQPGAGRPVVSTRERLLALLEVIVVFALIMTLLVVLRATAVYQWEIEHLGWSYIGMLIYAGIPAVVVWLTRRSWAEYGVSSADWRTNLDIGIKATLVRCIPTLLGWWTVRLLMVDSDSLLGRALDLLLWVIALALMVWLLNRQKPVKSGRANVMLTLVLLLLPIAVALAMGKLTVVIVPPVAWHFPFPGFV